MKLFKGFLTDSGECQVQVCNGKSDKALSLRLELRNHSPSGFAWGYGGSGPAQLALALLAEIFPQETALANYQRFKWDVVEKLPGNHPWEISEKTIREWFESSLKSENAL